MILYKVLLFLFLFPLLSPLGYAGGIAYENSPPPVEKGKPPVEKGKKAKKKKQKRAKKLRWKQQKQKALQQTEDSGTFLLVALIGLLVLAIAGAVIFGLGISTAALWIVGLSMIALSNLVGLIIVLIIAKSSSGGGSNITAGILVSFIALLMLIDFIVGITFFIWGLSLALPLAWIVGIILMSIALIVFLILLFTILLG